MLQDLTQQGYSTEDIKKAVVDTLSPFFDHPEKASLYWTSSELLSVFEFMIRYHYDQEFKDGFSEVLSLYKAAIACDENQTLSIICDTLFDFSQKENIMWTVRENVQKIDVGDYFEKTINYMKHIGDTLEIGTKHLIYELWALMQLADGTTNDYREILKLDFGVVIQNILDKQRFKSVLTTPPISIKLSDWRNIAYHHTYRLIDEQHISCTYGKKQISFTISAEELTQYTHKIVRSSNILNIARCLFVFDYSDLIYGYRNNHNSKQSIRFRNSILENNLRISILSQGFYLDSIIEDAQTIVASIVDLLNDGALSPENERERYIHASQFLYEIWCTFNKNQVQIKYMSSQNDIKLICSVDGKVCEAIRSGEKELQYMAQYVSFKFGQHLA